MKNIFVKQSSDRLSR